MSNTKININLNSEYVTIYYYKPPQSPDEVMVAQLGRKESGKTALQIAIEKCNIEIIKLLVAIPEININMHSNYVEHFIWKNPEDNDEKGMHVFTVPKKKAPLHFAVEMKNISIIRLLLQQESIDI